MTETKPAAPEQLNREKVIELYREKVPAALQDFYIQFMPEELKDDPAEIDKLITADSQNRFTAALIYICKTVFKNRKLLKLQAYKHSMPGYEHSQSTEYDIQILEAVLDIYIFICHKYDKDISIYGFCSMTGITQDIIYTWYRDYKNAPFSDNRDNVSSRRFKIYKRLSESRQEALTGKLLNSKSNAIGILAALNHLYGWNDPGRPAEQTAPAALPADSLPLFDSVLSMGRPELPTLEEQNSQ